MESMGSEIKIDLDGFGNIDKAYKNGIERAKDISRTGSEIERARDRIGISLGEIDSILDSPLKEIRKIKDELIKQEKEFYGVFEEYRKADLQLKIISGKYSTKTVQYNGSEICYSVDENGNIVYSEGKIKSYDEGRTGQASSSYTDFKSDIDAFDTSDDQVVATFLHWVSGGELYDAPSKKMYKTYEGLSQSTSNALDIIGFAYGLGLEDLAASKLANIAGKNSDEVYDVLKELKGVETKGAGNATAKHAVVNEKQAQSVLNGIDPQYFNKKSRFGGGFYVGADSDTIVAELA